jgi:hypothetical protein
MGKKQIVVPKDARAREALDTGASQQADLVEVTLRDAEFQLLWSAGVFEAINEAAGSAIDDYEDEGISDPLALAHATDCLAELQKKAEGDLAALLRLLTFLFKEASHRATEVHFFF